MGHVAFLEQVGRYDPVIMSELDDYVDVDESARLRAVPDLIGGGEPPVPAA